MRRILWLAIGLTLAAVTSASAQSNCITINGITRCTAPWQIYDGSAEQVSVPVLDLTQVWNNPATTFTGLKLNVTDSGSATASLLMDLQVAGASKFSVTKAGSVTWGGIFTVNQNAIATTSTDGWAIQNSTASTAGVPVQMSPRLKWCGSAYNSTSTLSETDCWFAENLPATVAGTTTSTWKLGSIINGGAATYPFSVNNAGVAFATQFSATSNIGTGGVFFGTSGGAQIAINVADGTAVLQNGAATIGSRLKADALPTVSSCGAGSPAVVAGSTPLSGSVTIGTTSVATCLITFNGTAFPSAPQCTGSVQTSTAANVRAMGYSATTTALTIVPATAWVDSSVVNWHCISSK